MPDERKVIIDRANRMLEQSRTLRRLANELQQESRDLKASANETALPGRRGKARRSGDSAEFLFRTGGPELGAANLIEPLGFARCA
jgi:hypothetical protein